MLFLPARRSILTPLVRDLDARDYIRRVEAADGQPLENGVRRAIDQFVRGCKADGIWTAIKACCILAGGRTLAGALVPLVGPAPTNFNFVSGDYDRKTGLLGNGTSKYLDSGRNNTDDPQNDCHISTYITKAPVASSRVMLGTGLVAGRHSFISAGDSTFYRSRNNLTIGAVDNLTLAGFIGGARSAADQAVFRRLGVEVTSDAASEAPDSAAMGIFATGSGATPSDARLAFYSGGRFLSVSALDPRVTTLVNAIAAAIP